MEYEFGPDVSSYQLYDQESLSSSQNAGTHKAIASGYLHKLAGNSVAKRWHQRYYVLYSDGLLYSYHNARSRTSHRTISLGRFCLRMKFGEGTIKGDCKAWPRSVPPQHRFSLINTDRSYHFYTDSLTDLNMWKHYLESTLGRLSSTSQVILDELTRPNTSLLEDNQVASQESTHREARENASSEEDDVPYDDYKPIGLTDQGKSDSEESIEYLHNTNSPVDKMLDTTFGEITSFMQ